MVLGKQRYTRVQIWWSVWNRKNGEELPDDGKLTLHMFLLECSISQSTLNVCLG